MIKSNKKVEKRAKEKTSWTICPECKGRGKKSRRISKKVKLSYQKAVAQFEQSDEKGTAPIPPKGHLYPCPNCSGAGLTQTDQSPAAAQKKYPHVAIIGGGIGGVALAVACLHRSIPFTLYERDDIFDARRQGYGLTLQQASKAIEGFGITSLKDGVVSTKHLVHTTEGKIIGEWGMRKWQPESKQTSPKRTNVHIARQSLRLALLEQLGEQETIQWGHQLVALEEADAEGATLTFEVNGKLKKVKADLVVGADGIRSTVRNLLIGEASTPLRYLDCMVILGICPLESLNGLESPLLDSATVFQTANGNERIYMMPYASDSVMWQLSFPISEKEAKELSTQGAKALKAAACRRADWHLPIPEILAATGEAQISGYPVYDRALLKPEMLAHLGQSTLIGDAAHPMSPFKGQGANQALLDALALARSITDGCSGAHHWKKGGLRKSVLNDFESEMLERSARKVEDSATAAKLLHSETVLHEVNAPRGSILKKGTE